MKFILALISISMLFSAVIGETILPNAGILPDSPFYFLDTIGEQIHSFIYSFNNQMRSELHYAFAGEKLAEANELAQTNNFQYMEQSMNQYDMNLNESFKFMNMAELENKNMTQLRERIMEHEELHIQTMEQIRDSDDCPIFVQNKIQNTIQNEQILANQIRTKEQVGIANPSAVKCLNDGYRYEIRDETGGQKGYCIFSDGSECGAWNYYNGICSPDL